VISREFHEALPSTQDRALELARNGAAEGTRVVARRQTGGRGRGGRAWASPEGGLYLSIVLESPTASPALLPLAIGARLARAFSQRYGVPTRLKWPNDLVVLDGAHGARKLSGILIDEVASPAGRRAVAGIGVNVDPPRGALPPEVAPTTASLSEFAVPPPRIDDVEAVTTAAALEARRELASPGGPAGALRACSELLYGVGHRASVDGNDGAIGTIEALGADGELQLRTDTGTVSVRTGTLRVEGRP
jgi:BirA family transcriptional regulator, biotin operon repressor / biotin---[acetyl-CoA-carboxylase] ligase